MDDELYAMMNGEFPELYPRVYRRKPREIRGVIDRCPLPAPPVDIEDEERTHRSVSTYDSNHERKREYYIHARIARGDDFSWSLVDAKNARSIHSRYDPVLAGSFKRLGSSRGQR